jgi:putative serine protease PepD
MTDTTGDRPDQLVDWGDNLDERPGPIMTFPVEPARVIHVTSPRPRWPVMVGMMLAGLIGAASASAILLLADDDAPPPTTVAATTATTVPSVTGAAPSTAESSTATEVAALVIPSIVTVEVSSTASDEFVADASGSGVVLTSSGTIVTNQHVVDGSAAIRVVFADGRTYTATLLGEDGLTDLAVIDIQTEGLIPIAIGSSRSMSIGDTAIAIGSPLGLEGGPSVTVGVLSAFDRRVDTGEDTELFGMLQTDAPITRGSSGGALVDAQGRLIGITSAIGVSDVGAEGLGFAIPVEMVERITADLIATGVSPHPFLGISGATHFETQVDGALAPAGVEVAEVIADTAAALGGLAVGDIITTFDGKPVVTMDRLVVELRYFRVGDIIELGITRNGAPMALAVTLLERPEDV